MHRSRKWRLVAVIPAAGALWWIVGFLPWLLEGLGPVPPVALASASSTEQAHLALPLVGSALHHLVLGGIVGGLCGAAAALLARDRRLVAAGASFLGVALALTVTLVQSVSALEGVDHHYASDSRVLLGLGLVTVSATLGGWLLGAVATAGPVGAGVALAAAAGALQMWVTSVVAAPGDRPVDYIGTITTAAGWAGAALLAAALVVTALRRTVLVLVWPVLLALAWVIGPVVTATGYAEVYLRPGLDEPDLGEVMTVTWDVFTMALDPANRSLAPWIAAVVVAALVIVALRLRGTRPSQGVATA